jgi:hypothetical protein
MNILSELKLSPHQWYECFVRCGDCGKNASIVLLFVSDRRELCIVGECPDCHVRFASTETMETLLSAARPIIH